MNDLLQLPRLILLLWAFFRIIVWWIRVVRRLSVGWLAAVLMVFMAILAWLGYPGWSVLHSVLYVAMIVFILACTYGTEALTKGSDRIL
jgi:hypothetical protein